MSQKPAAAHLLFDLNFMARYIRNMEKRKFLRGKLGLVLFLVWSLMSKSLFIKAPRVVFIGNLRIQPRKLDCLYPARLSNRVEFNTLA
jgi:hypothetical protein